MNFQCEESLAYLADDKQIEKNRAKMEWVTLFSFLAMIAEIGVGSISHSMGLLAEGWHMASHVGAMGISLLAYHLAKSKRLQSNFSFGSGKFFPLGGYTSAIILTIVALLILMESVQRIYSPVAIEFNEAITIAALGLIVNIVSALILQTEHHHGHSHDASHHHGSCEHGHQHLPAHVHDHNIRSAFLHILADAVTSVLAIGALIVAKCYHWSWLDPAVGVIGALVIFSWSFRLCRDTAWELLDGHSVGFDSKKLKSAFEKNGTKINDFHVWRIAPKALACELVVSATDILGPAHYREILRQQFAIQHIVVEERRVSG